MKRQLVTDWMSANIRRGSDDECWEASGCRTSPGWHVKFKAEGGRHLAHRAAWIVAFGDIPAGLCVLHKCDNPVCCNPRPLFLGTRADNVADMWSKGRAVVGSNLGKKYCASKTRSMTLERARLAIEEFARGKTQRQIGLLFNVTDVSIGNLLRGKTYPELYNERKTIAHLLGRQHKRTRMIYRRMMFLDGPAELAVVAPVIIPPAGPARTELLADPFAI